jgi:hypothetical protein
VRAYSLCGEENGAVALAVGGQLRRDRGLRRHQTIAKILRISMSHKQVDGQPALYETRALGPWGSMVRNLQLRTGARTAT